MVEFESEREPDDASPADTDFQMNHERSLIEQSRDIVQVRVLDADRSAI
jgi:hypothetical protein